MNMLNFNWLAEMPINIARFFVLLAFIIPLVFAFVLPKAYVYLGSQDQKKWRNLKWWILVLVLIQVTIYSLF